MSDVVVVGSGVFGAWTAWHLAHAGALVTLVDAYGPGNARSSSGDESRIVRANYGAAAHYVGMGVRALELWRDFEKAHAPVTMKEATVGGAAAAEAGPIESAGPPPSPAAEGAAPTPPKAAEVPAGT